MTNRMRPDDIPLDLASLDPPVWHVEVNGKVYGPYTLGQLQGFIQEGRVGRTTLIARGEDFPFVPAGETEALLSSFQTEQDEAPATAAASNFIIISRMDADTPLESRAALSRALNGLGRFAEAMPGIFVLRAKMRLPDVRRLIGEVAGEMRILIVEAREGRLGWLGLGADADRHIRKIWNSELD